MDIFIDIGSTNIKYKRDGERVQKTPFPKALFCKNDKFEVDANEIVDIIKDIVKDATRAYISVQMHGYVLMKNGKAVTNYISWRDERAKNEKANFELNKEYGVDIKPNLPRLSLQTQTVDFDCFCTLGSYVAYQLTGNNKTHITDAAPSGFYNVYKKSRVKTKFELPNVSYFVDSVGSFNGCEIYTPIGDQQCSILGAVGFNYDGLILNLGTAGQMCCIEEGFTSGQFESRPYFNGRTLCTVTRLIGGGVISKYSDDEILAKMIEDYSLAMQKLPQKKQITITGGVVEHRKSLLERFVKTLGIKYSFNIESDTIKGLEIISKGEKG